MYGMPTCLSALTRRTLQLHFRLETHDTTILVSPEDLHSQPLAQHSPSEPLETLLAVRLGRVAKVCQLWSVYASNAD